MEEVLWKGKPFNFGLPSFTKYEITDSRIIVQKGIFTKRRDEIRLYRIRDISTKRNLFERIINIGDITVFSSDTNHAEFILRNIKNSTQVSDLLGETVEKSRIKHRALEVAGIME
ncbi:MAG: PH domain-containing protein [Candidatus Pristimantibacillus lignocellulolyticus]|uniref:PH domain-containing protein n=1 Tax=Candidatus Pristimantibacillus lignocellulolyticus TaxID=2994561 RepID=A0A9J6Z9M1_9BACL|nr:MAG: PH domain-containing protein [Candidatus Pristimantibacillus lignocellulolyticus]